MCVATDFGPRSAIRPPRSTKRRNLVQCVPPSPSPLPPYPHRGPRRSSGGPRPPRPSHLCLFNSDGRTDKPSTCLPACLPDLVAGVRCPGDAPLMPSNRCFARPEPPVRLPPSLRRQTEKAKRRREKKSWLINPATTVGALALTRLLIGRGGRPGPRRWLARPLR